jgi:hypothetical protein
MIAPVEFIEPSDTERAQWPECTAQYVANLEAEIEHLTAVVDAMPKCWRLTARETARRLATHQGQAASVGERGATGALGTVRSNQPGTIAPRIVVMTRRVTFSIAMALATWLPHLRAAEVV